MEQELPKEGLTLPPLDAHPPDLDAEAHEKARLAAKKRQLAFELVREMDGPGTTTVYAKILARPACYYGGDTEEEAIASLLHGVAELARDGKMDPDDPLRLGVFPIQHAMQILQRAMALEIEQRREYTELLLGDAPPDGYPLDPPSDHGEDYEKKRKREYIVRRSQTISGIATAIAALGRVAEL
jgi:hypothetical protein